MNQSMAEFFIDFKGDFKGYITMVSIIEMVIINVISNFTILFYIK